MSFKKWNHNNYKQVLKKAFLKLFGDKGEEGELQRQIAARKAVELLLLSARIFCRPLWTIYLRSYMQATCGFTHVSLSTWCLSVTLWFIRILRAILNWVRVVAFLGEIQTQSTYFLWAAT